MRYQAELGNEYENKYQNAKQQLFTFLGTIDDILANAGIQVRHQGIVSELTWIPVFTGMTMCV